MTKLQDVLAEVDGSLEASIGRWTRFLEIPSISTDPAYAADCRRAGQWACDQLAAMGFDARLHDTPGHPMVVAHNCPHDGADAPHVLFYGHYDVQPAVPLEEWNTPPFEPSRQKAADGSERIFARGAADDKGQLMTFLEASRAWLATAGTLPLNVTVLLEGEEESGSPSLDGFLQSHVEELSRDVALVCDTGMWDADTAAITTRLRGIVHDEVIVHGPTIDLHSGYFGGAAANPIHVLAGILADMRDADGSITIPGFYDGVRPVPEETARQWQALDVTPEQFLSGVGLSELAGEKGRSVLEQTWSRPTAEVNGIIGGYTGAGSKTIVPAKASAKISFRLVSEQNPAKIKAAFRAFVRSRLPADCRAEFVSEGDGSPASEIPEDNPWPQMAAEALRDEFGKPAVMMGCGGSIPIVRSFKDVLGMESLLVGFGLADDAIHSPNEKYDLNSFHRGIRSWARIMDRLARQ